MAIERDEILAHACDLFLEEGVEGFSMRALADRVGVTAPALYRHFRNREAVLLAVVDEAYRAMIRHLQRALEGGSPGERFRMAGAGYVDFALEHPRFYQIVYASPEWMGVEDVGDVRERHACAIGQFWDDRVRECMDAGLLREAEPEAVGLTLWAHAHGLVSIYLQGMLDVEPETFRELFMASGRRALAGLATPALFEEVAARPAEGPSQALAETSGAGSP